MNILSFGEIIWDCFPEARYLGGAPLNFAVHAARQGADSYIYSAVGDAESFRAVADTGVKTDFLQTVPFPTGYTNIRLDKAGNPTYQVVHNVAWDNIPTLEDIPLSWDAVYFGTLCQRSPISAASLRALLERVQAREFFCDLNLRHKFFSDELIDFCLAHASIVKVNRQEKDALPPDVFQKYPGLKALLVTLDAEGALLRLADGRELSSQKPRGKLVSAVGAGDSFSAAFLVKWLEGAAPEDCLAAGLALADEVIGQMGAF